MGSDKLWADLGETPVLGHSLIAFQRAASIRTIVLVTRPERADDCSALARTLGILKLVEIRPGGARRQDSVRAGLDALDPTVHDVVVVHDAARPLVEVETIDEGVRLARERGSAIAAVPAVDTIKRVSEIGQIEETPDRRHLWVAQTPQCFQTRILQRAHASITSDATDDAAMVEALGEPVWVYLASRRNIKITTPEDLAIAHALLSLNNA